MNVPGWGPVVIDLAGVDLSNLQDGILSDHDSTLKGILGYGEAIVEQRSVQRDQHEGLVSVRQPAGRGHDRRVPARKADADG